MKKSKRIVGDKFMIFLTAMLIVLSGGAIGAKVYLTKTKPAEVTAAKAQEVEPCETSAENLTAGDVIECGGTVKITDGAAYVKFDVTLADSDGVSFDEKLEDLSREIEEHKEKLEDKDLASYQSFFEEYHYLLNDYNKLYAKAELAASLIYKDEGESIDTEKTYDSAELEKLTENGKISGMERGFSGYLAESEEGFERSYVSVKEYSAGETAEIFTNVVVPADWGEMTESVTVYTLNEDRSFSEEELEIADGEIMGDGFKIITKAYYIG